MKIKYLLLCFVVGITSSCIVRQHRDPEYVEPSVPRTAVQQQQDQGSQYVSFTGGSQQHHSEYTAAELQWRQGIIKENRRILDALREKGAEVFYSKRGVVVILSDVLFAFDKDDLKPAARDMVRNIADVAISTERKISVEGHTDAVGSVMYNQDLSMRRSQSVAKALTADGVPPGRLTIRGYGKGNPIVDNNSPENRALNRRVEVVIENQEYVPECPE